ncbi:hypothetical protein FHL15_005393 [Xylaria flabelliformis]|uniref:Cytochrome P450 n=1 Tax=Xylaria flabelliformis TaxID=2512241 RepID=A0A553I0I5_9PEZI|nr:hypothetical protein FHL15_005393 [Xylaria flabelliformis]
MLRTSLDPRPPALASGSPKSWKAHEWPVLGSALRFYSKRHEMIVEGTMVSLNGNFSFFADKRHIVSLSGFDGRKTFLKLRSSVYLKDWRVTDVTQSVYLLLYKLIHRSVGVTEIAENDELLVHTPRIFEKFERSTSVARIIFPWLITPKYFARLVAGARLYNSILKILNKHNKTGGREEDALQYIYDEQGDSDKVIKFIFSALSSSVMTGAAVTWLTIFLANSPEWQEKCRDEIDFTISKCQTSLDRRRDDVLNTMSLQICESSFPTLYACLQETLRITSTGIFFRKNEPQAFVGWGSGRHLCSRQASLSTADKWLTRYEQLRSFPSVTHVDNLTPEILSETRDQLKIFLLACRDTTGTSIGWAIYELSLTPHALNGVREEVNAILGPQTDALSICSKIVSARIADKDMLGRMPYTHAVVKETPKFHPPVGAMRYSKKGAGLTVHDSSTGKTHCLDGLAVYLCMSAIHRNPNVYEETADDFSPERWLDSTESAKVPKTAWRPFERGPRSCIGQELAMTEICLVLALVTQCYDFRKRGLGGATFNTRGEPIVDSKTRQYKIIDELYNVLQLVPKPVDRMRMEVDFARYVSEEELTVSAT